MNKKAAPKKLSLEQIQDLAKKMRKLIEEVNKVSATLTENNVSVKFRTGYHDEHLPDPHMVFDKQL